MEQTKARINIYINNSLALYAPKAKRLRHPKKPLTTSDKMAKTPARYKQDTSNSAESFFRIRCR